MGGGTQCQPLQPEHDDTLRTVQVVGSHIKCVRYPWTQGVGVGGREAGVHELNFDASGLPSGVYLYRVRAGEYVAAKKLLLLKVTIAGLSV
jgi:hypothetical protein